MNTQLQIDDQLLQEALTLGKHQNQQTLVEEALKEYIQHRKQAQILELFGTIEYNENYEYINTSQPVFAPKIAQPPDP